MSDEYTNHYTDSDIDFIVRYFLGDYIYNYHNININSDSDVFKLILGSVCIDYIQ